jgi:hypothetical protein
MLQSGAHRAINPPPRGTLPCGKVGNRTIVGYQISDTFHLRFAAAVLIIADFFEEQARAGGPAADILTDVAAELRGLPPATAPEQKRLPGTRHLKAALPEALDGALARLVHGFMSIEPESPWMQTEHYRASLGDAYMDNYGYITLVGDPAIVKHDRIACGYFLIGPGQHYPEHHHEAEEVYFPLSGDTLWRQGDEEPRAHAIGDAIHNPPWLKHEMWTRETPLFALYCWRGPIANQAQLTNP